MADRPWVRSRPVLAIGALAASGLLYCCAKVVYHQATTPDDDGPIEPAEPTRERGPVSRVPVGTNLAEITWGADSLPFVDAMKQSDPFWSATADEWNDGRALTTSPEGWPTRLAPGQIARTFLVGGDDPHHPGGTYVVLWEGEGELRFQGGVQGEPRVGDHRIELEVQPPNGLWIDIVRVDPQDPIRNVRVLLPGGRCEASATTACTSDADCEGRCVPFEETYEEQPFHPTFLAELMPFGVLRFMDWQQTNRVSAGETPPWWPVREWSEVPTPAASTWRRIPPAVAVALANETGADPWLCVPNAASDGYVRELATLVKEQLDPRLKVYVEYTNEYWNDIFGQHQEINAAGCARFSSDAPGECDPDGNGELCEYTEWNETQERCLRYGERYFAVRTAEIGAIFGEVFGDETDERVVRVLGMQVGGVRDRGVGMLEQQWRDGEAVHRAVDAVAIAPYFGGGDNHPPSVDAAFARIDEARHGAPAGTYEVLAGREDDEWGGVYKWIRDDVRALRTSEDLAHLQLIAYEGGQHFVSHQEGPLHERFLAINRDPRMRELYAQYLRTWHELTDGATFVHYTSSGAWSIFGYWGSKERQGQPRSEAPKHDALLTYVEGLQP